MRETQVNPFRYEPPTTFEDTVSFANANAYGWGYRDFATDPAPVRDGWPNAWMEYVRRNPSRMSIQDGFPVWQDTGTLPGLD
jgi:hypothetical protein